MRVSLYFILRPFKENLDGDETFWDELIDRLAMRDVINEVGEEDFYKMDGLERITLIDRASKYYADEFALNGVQGIWVGPQKLLTTNKH